MNTQRTTIMRGIYNNVQILGGADNKDFRSAAIISPFVMSIAVPIFGRPSFATFEVVVSYWESLNRFVVFFIPV